MSKCDVYDNDPDLLELHPVRWRLGLHGDPIAVFDHIVLHLHQDGTVTWSDQIANIEAKDDTDE